jgi:8-oxo-dGTP diphosphatase
MSQTFSFNYFGSTIIAESLGIDYLPPLNQILSAHCVPVTADGKIVAVDIVGRGVDFPGGHIEGDETAVEAMHRETREEAYISVKEPVLIDVWKLSSDDKKLGLRIKPYILSYLALVEQIDDFIANDEVSRRLVLDPDEFVSMYFGNKAQAEKIISLATASLSPDLK